MALTICSQFVADIGRTEAISYSSLHFSNQSNSRRSESFTLCSPNELSPLVRNKRMPDRSPDSTSCKRWLQKLREISERCGEPRQIGKDARRVSAISRAGAEG